MYPNFLFERPSLKNPVFYPFLKIFWQEKNGRRKEIRNLEKIVYFKKFEGFPQKKLSPKFWTL